MARRYDSFLIRRWELEGSEPRIEVEHIQSGRRVQVSSLAHAIAWMDGERDKEPAAEGMG